MTNGKTNKPILIFDFDGTIADTMVMFQETLESLEGKFGFEREHVIKLSELRSKTVKEVFKEIGLPLSKVPFIVNECHRKFVEKKERFKPVKGVKKAILELKEAGCQVGIITSNSKDNVDYFLKNNELDIFDFVCSEKNIFGKAEKIKK